MAEEENGTFAAKASKVWKSRQVAWASVVVLTLAIVVAAVMVGLSIFAPVKPEGAAAPVPPAVSDTASAQPSATAPTGPCNVPAGDMSLRPAVPEDLRWLAAQGITWPVSDTYGPTKNTDGFDVCFARSPLGAALAATTMLYSQFNGHSPKEMTKFYIVDSPGKTIALKSAGDGTSASSLTQNGMSLAGFMVNEFTPDRAAVSLVYNFPKSDTGFAGIPTTLVWVDGDWRIKLLDNGDTGTATKPVQGQFVEWSPSNG